MEFVSGTELIKILFTIAVSTVSLAIFTIIWDKKQEDVNLEIIVAWGMIICSPLTFIGIVKAEFGKFVAFKGFWLGPLVEARLVWALMESPNLVFAAVYGYLYGFKSTTNLLMFGMFVFHYTYRTLIYPLRLAKSNKVPLFIGFMAFIYTTINGFLQSYTLCASKQHQYEDKWLRSPQFIIGSAIWAAGWLINYHSDLILINLRKPGETGYKIPQGGMFEYVTCAHYFGEIMEWSGYAIACWSLPAVAFAAFVFGNLASRALVNRKWYVSKFGDEYPQDRKAVIPFLL
mmetsp:Transcript_23447/g.46214  ORF Transcript_23447/g.46214 Transcript_23447/m.46214 type:complete len:288 (+) Transcript_23447:20-883(+)